MGTILNGHTIFIEHEASKDHRSTYQIDNITKLKDGNYRVDLQDNPRFTLFRFKLKNQNPKKQAVFLDRDTIIGGNRPYLFNRLVYFPDSGFKTSVVKTNASGYRAWLTSE